MEIELSKATLRAWQSGDEESLVRHANNRAIWRNLRDAFPHPYTYADASHWIEVANPTKKITNFAIVVDGSAVGLQLFSAGDSGRALCQRRDSEGGISGKEGRDSFRSIALIAWSGSGRPIEARPMCGPGRFGYPHDRERCPLVLRERPLAARLVSAGR